MVDCRCGTAFRNEIRRHVPADGTRRHAGRRLIGEKELRDVRFEKSPAAIQHHPAEFRKVGCCGENSRISNPVRGDCPCAVIGNHTGSRVDCADCPRQSAVNGSAPFRIVHAQRMEYPFFGELFERFLHYSFDQEPEQDVICTGVFIFRHRRAHEIQRKNRFDHFLFLAGEIRVIDLNP